MSNPIALRRRLALAGARSRTLLGRSGVVALILLVAAAATAWWTPRIRDEAGALHARAEAESVRAHARVLELPPDPATQMAQFRDWFPESARNVEDLRTIFRVAKRQQVQLVRGDYVANRQPETRLATFDVVLPVRASYASIRAFVASVLNELPHASLADLRMERATGELLDARIHLTLFYRED